MKTTTKFLRRSLIALAATFLLVPFGTAAQQINLPGLQLGMIGVAEKTPIQISEARVAYRFEQGGNGKSFQAVPVQMTYRLHNPAATQTIEVLMPVVGQEGEAPEVTAIFVNGKEQPLAAPAVKRYFGLDQAYRSVAFNLTLPKDADAIVDIRALQPIVGENIPFAFQTARAWSENISTGTIEGFFPFSTANWNVALRELKAEPTLIPLTYSGRTASWTFTNLNQQTSSDIFWQVANLEAMAYYEQGLDRWRADNNDPQAYAILQSALKDMIPCHNEQMPLITWWNSMYDTVTVGILSSLPQGDEQDTKALEYFSNNWTVPQGDEKTCIAMQQRPERYRSALNYLLQIPNDQRSALVQQTLEKHYEFLNRLSVVMGENSLSLDANNIPNSDPFGNSKLSEKDKNLLAVWDYRFSGQAPGQNATSTPPTGTATPTGIGSAVSSTLAGLLQRLPKLSFGTQIILFALLALIVLIIIGFIVFRWQENPTIPERTKESGTQPPPTPLMGSGLGSNRLSGGPRVDLTKPQSPPVAPPVTPETKHEPENIFKPPVTPPPPIAPQTPPPPTPKPSEPETKSPSGTPSDKPEEQRPKDVNNNEPKPPLTI